MNSIPLRCLKLNSLRLVWPKLCNSHSSQNYAGYKNILVTTKKPKEHMLLQRWKSWKCWLETEKQMCFTKWTSHSMKVFNIKTFAALECKTESCWVWSSDGKPTIRAWAADTHLPFKYTETALFHLQWSILKHFKHPWINLINQAVIFTDSSSIFFNCKKTVIFIQ